MGRAIKSIYEEMEDAARLAKESGEPAFARGVSPATWFYYVDGVMYRIRYSSVVEAWAVHSVDTDPHIQIAQFKVRDDAIRYLSNESKTVKELKDIAGQLRRLCDEHGDNRAIAELLFNASEDVRKIIGKLKPIEQK